MKSLLSRGSKHMLSLQKPTFKSKKKFSIFQKYKDKIQMLFQSINDQSDHKNNIHSKQPERNKG